MVAKIIEGTSFKGCVNYLLKDKSEVIDFKGICTVSPQTMIRDFNLQRQLNPNLAKAVGHIVLAWHEKDSKRIDSSIMASVARQYLEKLGIKDTQYLAVRHYDRNHPHLHIVYNRIDFQGKTIANGYQKVKSVKLCKELNAKYRFHQASGKENVNIGRLKGADKVKYQMFEAINAGKKVCKDWNHLESFLKYKGITVQFKYRGQTNEIQGVSFSKADFTFKGSEIDRSLSFKQINKIFDNEPSLYIASGKNQIGEPVPEPMARESGWFGFQIDISHDQDDEAGKRKKKTIGGLKMELENVKQQLEELQLNTTLLTKDVANVLPSILEILTAVDESVKQDQHRKLNAEADRQLLIKCIKDINVSIDNYINDYGNLQSLIEQVIGAAQHQQRQLDKGVQEVTALIDQMPAKTEIKHRYEIDFQAKGKIGLFVLFVFTVIGFGMSLGLFVNQQSLQDDNIKWRMAKLEMPALAIMIDSIYHADENHTEFIVTKREEEAQLLLKALQKRKEIRNMEKR